MDTIAVDATVNATTAGSDTVEREGTYLHAQFLLVSCESTLEWESRICPVS